MIERDLNMAGRLAAQIRDAGGRAFFVGGCVRDEIAHREYQDIDIEVHDVPREILEGILDRLGEKTREGAGYGIYGLKGYSIDVALPRTEWAVGKGHRDFRVRTDPFLGLENAASRRDFTVNAMMKDVLTGEIVDPFGGLSDLKCGRIRHVNGETFADDPLRVLRGAQFAARLDGSIAEETRELGRKADLRTLPKERVMGELKKALEEAKRPSIFFEELRRMGQLSVWFPELASLIGVEQSPLHHPEGDVWTHTMLVLDEAAKLRDRAEYPLGFLLAALCHDFGKAVTTTKTDGVIHAYGHEMKGLPLAKTFLTRLSGEVRLRKYVLNLVRLHMRPNMLVLQGAKKKSYYHMFDEAVSPADLLLLSRADYLGRGGDTFADEYGALEGPLSERLREYREIMERPHVTGDDLLAAGIPGGPEFKELLAFAHKLRLAGLDRETSLRQTLARARRSDRVGG